MYRQRSLCRIIQTLLQKTDPRTTIYWHDNVVTGTDGKASVHFYTADAATTYSVIITGVTLSGEQVYKRIALNRK